MLDSVKKVIIELFWPIVRELVKKYSKQLIEWMVEKMKAWAVGRNTNNERAAESQAQAADAAAKEAVSPSEAEKHAAVAKVWRDVAEMFRRENEILAAELQKLRAVAIAENNVVADSFTYEQAVQEKDGKLQVRAHLPRLPS